MPNMYEGGSCCGTSLTYGRNPAFEAVEPTLYVAPATLDDPDAGICLPRV